MSESKRNIELIRIFKKGYRVIDGVVYNPNGKVLKGCVHSNGYRFIHCSNNGLVPVHRLVALQKFGSKLFEPGIMVRHLDNNPLNNHEWNIALGTNRDNQLDRNAKDREQDAINAATHIRKFTDKELILIRNYYEECRSYKDTMAFWGISSKGTLHYILNTEYKTIKEK